MHTQATVKRMVGPEVERSSSNGLELVAFVFVLLRRNTPVTPMLYVFDNQELLKAVERLIGEGGEATSVRAPDADTLRDTIKKLRQRTTVRVVMFLVKVKAHCECVIGQTVSLCSGQGDFRQRYSHAMARQDKSSSLHVLRASPERRQGKQWRSAVKTKISQNLWPRFNSSFIN